MAERTDEQLSALMDGECDIPEVELALRRLANDVELKRRWQRYHLIGDTIRNYLPESINTGFTDHIMKMIDNEPPLQTVAASSFASWYKPMTGFGLAASIALIAVFGLELDFSGQPSGAVAKSSVSAGSGLTASNPGAIADATSPGVENVDPNRETRDALKSRLNNYLVNHNEYASMNGVQGVLPYVRIVGYQPNP